MARTAFWEDYALVGALTLLYLLLPTHNSTLDAWYYAACVKHGHELLLAHHLWYNPAGWLWVQGLAWLGVRPDALAALKALNAVAAGASLLVVRQLVHRTTRQPVWPWLLLAGSSFGLMRFATENETYVLPLLLSLLGSWCWSQWLRGGRPGWWLGLAGFWAALACLFHQIHVFWWLGLLLGTWRAVPSGSRRWEAALGYCLPAVVVPVAYLGALANLGYPLTLPALWRFIFHDYYAGTAGGTVSGKGLLLAVVSLARTFGQLHGSMGAVLRAYPLAWGSVAGALLLGAYAAWVLWRRRGVGAWSLPDHATRSFCQTHVLILILHVLFAAYSEGNAEFMVMLPALVALLGGVGWPTLPWRPVAAMGSALLLWNLTFGLLPGHLLRFTDQRRLLARIRQEPTTWFLLENHNLALNQLHYQTGQAVPPPNVCPAPAQLARRAGWSGPQFQEWVRQQRRAGRRVLTDGLRQPHLLDRAQLLQDNQSAALLRGFTTVAIDSFPTSWGTYYLTEIR